VKRASYRAAQAYGELAAATQRQGARVRIVDGQIAAIAKVHRMSVARREVSGFLHTGVVVVNPWKND